MPEMQYNARGAGLPPELALQDLKHGDKRWRFRRPLRVALVPGEGGVTLEAELLGIHAFGATYAEALAVFAQHFASAWTEIGLAADAELSGDARDLKRLLLDLVEEAREGLA